ncbi:uncharacterized protein LOC144579914 [Callithrix jacchus]
MCTEAHGQPTFLANMVLVHDLEEFSSTISRRSHENGDKLNKMEQQKSTPAKESNLPQLHNHWKQEPSTEKQTATHSPTVHDYRAPAAAGSLTYYKQRHSWKIILLQVKPDKGEDSVLNRLQKVDNFPIQREPPENNLGPQPLGKACVCFFQPCSAVTATD